MCWSADPGPILESQHHWGWKGFPEIIQVKPPAGPAGAGWVCHRGAVPGEDCDASAGVPRGSQTSGKLNSFKLEMKQFWHQKWYHWFLWNWNAAISVLFSVWMCSFSKALIWLKTSFQCYVRAIFHAGILPSSFKQQGLRAVRVVYTEVSNLSVRKPIETWGNLSLDRNLCASLLSFPGHLHSSIHGWLNVV